MRPLDFLKQELENVGRALDESLRYEYGPERSRPYYHECAARLQRVKRATRGIAEADAQAISDQLAELAYISNWIFLIERSRLGEFSRPFAEEIRSLARALLAEPHIRRGKIEPIVHVVAEGEGYRIIYEGEQVPLPSGGQRFAVVAFPKPLKHHVLLHALFGHELGHTALYTTGAGYELQASVIGQITDYGSLSNSQLFSEYLLDGLAPAAIRNGARAMAAQYAIPGEFYEYARLKWIDEFFCDLFGLLLFGPGFFAAHYTFLTPTHPEPYAFSATHPPHALRHRMLVQVVSEIGWNEAVVGARKRAVHKAEQALLRTIVNDPFPHWDLPFDDGQLRRATSGIRTVLQQYGGIEYDRPEESTLAALVECLLRRIPPVLVEFDSKDEPKPRLTMVSHILYAGWIYWFGRRELKGRESLSFLEVNRLCDLGLLQQHAIKRVIR